MWGLSLSFWQSVFFWSTVTAGVFGGISVTAAFVSAMVGYQISDIVQADADRRIEEAKSKGDEARAEASKANAEVARANEAIATENARASAMENDAAQARLEQERLKAQLAWRVLPPQIANSLERQLSQKPGKINIEHVANDTEALYLAIQIANVFGKAGWQTGMALVTIAATVAFGLWVPDSQSPLTQEVRSALASVGIGFSTGTLPAAGMAFGNSVAGAPTLFVGSKPIPP
jgi:hypothetical protein